MLLNSYRFGAAFTPSDLADLIVWLDTASAYITLNGSNLSSWEARNDAAIDFANATASEQPPYTGITLGGEQALDFDVDSLDIASLSPDILTGDFYTAMVARFAALPAESIMFGAAWPNYGVTFAQFAGEPTMSLGADRIFASHALLLNTDYVLEFWRDGTSVRCRVNGTLDTDSLTDSANVPDGDEWNVGWNQHEGRLGDIILTSSLPSSADRNACKGFLASKYGITVS